MGVLGGDRRAVAVADELLADPAGDARLRAAVRRARGLQRRARVRRRRAGRARAVRPDRARRRARAAARRPRRCGERRSRAGLAFVADAHLGPRGRRSSRRACATALREREHGRATGASRVRRRPPARAAGAAASVARACPSSTLRRAAGDRAPATPGWPPRTSPRSRPRLERTAARWYWRHARPEHRDDARRSLFGVWHGVPAVLEKTGPAAATSRPRTSTRWRAGRSPPAARSTTPTCSPTRSQRVGRLAGRRPARAGLRLLVRARRARAGGRATRRPSGTACDPNAEAIALGAASTCPGSRSPSRRRTRRCRTRTARFDFVVRDLDLVALRRARGARAGSTRCTGSSAPGGHLVLDDARAAVDRLLRARPATRPPRAARADPRARCTGAASGSRRSSARQGDWGVKPPGVGHRVLHARVARARRAARSGRSRTSRSARTPTTRRRRHRRNGHLLLDASGYAQRPIVFETLAGSGPER